MKRLVSVLIVGIIFLTGCVDNTKYMQDLNDIKDQLWQIRNQQSEQMKKLNEMEKKLNSGTGSNENADLIANQQEIQDNISAILERIKELNDKLNYLLGRVSSLEQNTQGQQSKTPVNSQTQNTIAGVDIANPDALFSQAYADYMKGNYDIAIIEFKDYIARFPNSEKVDNAYYWLGLCYFEKEKYRDAIDSFDRIIKDFPQSDVLASAMLKKGLALFEMGAAGMGAVQLQELIQKFPMSKEANIARKKLDALHIAN